MIIEVIRRFIEQEQLLDWKKKVLVALSGGADSVALLRILLHLGYDIEAAHCNFHLRGEESDRDEAFVKSLCQKLSVPLQKNDFDTQTYALRNKLSIEMAARELRYEWFGHIVSQVGAQAVAVAHHRDDSVETMLLNLIRGTGIAGLHGISPRNGLIVRPLLCVGRHEVLDYLEGIDQEYVTDSSNRDEQFLRNKIRHSLLPLMEEMNPNIRKGLMQTAINLSEVETVYRTAVEQSRTRVFIPEILGNTGLCEGCVRIEALLKEPSPKALLHEILSPYGFTVSQEEDLYRSLCGESGKKFTSGGWTLLKDREKLLLYKKSEKEEIPCFDIEERQCTSDIVWPRDPSVACIDADKVEQPLLLRRLQKGDWFIPLGMRGRKLISDFLTDRKKSVRDKESQLVLVDGDKIVWVVGERLDQRYRITELTKRIWIIRIKA